MPELLTGGSTVLTHCNAGGLATGGYGSALGVVRAAVESGKSIRVMAPETRPFLQGSRLTAWELARDGIPVDVITDGMSGHYLSRGEVAAVVVGADRIAANGDAANKIGTYTHAVLAKENGVPFYVAAPTTTIDLACPDGSAIPIEERSPDEVLSFAGHPIAPATGVGARHAAFDVTPARYIAAIVTEEGICRPPYGESLAAAVHRAGEARQTRAAEARASVARAVARQALTMLVLGIETSCDETSVAVLDGEGRVRSNVVSSQLAAHAPYGGVVPEIAARAHLENLPVAFEEALARGAERTSPTSTSSRRRPAPA